MSEEPEDTDMTIAYEYGFEKGRDFANKDQWQPIETLTPEESTAIMSTVSYLGGVTVASWFKYNGKAAWRDVDNDIIDDATHWMPIPPPPTGDSE